MKTRAMSSVFQRATSFDDLPHEISFHIFLRVPVKSQIRSSAVSKTWYSLIKNPDFLSAQISHAISILNNDAVLIIPANIMRDKHCYLISAETGFEFDKYEVPFTTTATNLKLVGSVNGLVCLTHDYIRRSRRFSGFRYSFPKTVYPHLHVWNPSIRKYKCIVSSSFRKRYAGEVGISYAVGFGFVEPSGDYRVVRIMYFSDDNGNQFEEVAPRVEVFSLRMNKWRPCTIENTVVPGVASEIGTTVNSTVYWLKARSSSTNSEGVWILSFDFISEVFGQIKLPDDVCYPLGEIMGFQLMKFEGSLSVYVHNHLITINKKFHRPCSIWLISHKDGIVSSSLRFRVVVLEQFGQPLNITKGGALLMAHSLNVLSYNLKSMQYEYLHKPPNYKPNYNVETFFIESLVGDELLTSAK